jgi:hypothetical protein
MEQDIAWNNTFLRIRYLDFFPGFPVASFEARDIIDQLLSDLGLEPERHGMKLKGKYFILWRRWFKEWFTSYSNAEYKEIIDEYLEVVRKRNSVRTF